MRSPRPLKRFLSLLWSEQPSAAAGYLGFALLRGLLPLAQLYLFKLIVDTVVLAVETDKPSELFPQVLSLVIAAGVVYWLNSGSATLDGWLRQRLVTRFTDRLFDRIHHQSVRVGLSYYENSEFRDSLHRAQREALSRPGQLLSQAAGLIQNSVSLVGIAALLITVHPLLGPALILASLPDVLLRLHFSRRWYRWERSRTQQQREARYMSWLLTTTLYAKEILLYGLGHLFAIRFRNQKDQLRGEKLDLLARQSRAELLAKSVAAVVIFGMYAFIAARALAGAVTLGDLVLVIQGLSRGGSMLQRLLAGLAAVVESNLFLSNLFEFLDREPSIRDADQPAPSPPTTSELRVEHLSFRYPNRDDLALEDVNFSLSPGEILAVVGSNGSGKTTLVKLLTRLYDPTEGRVLLGGEDLRDLAQADVRRRFSVIFQDYGRYHTSLRENVAVGAGRTEVSDDDLQRVAEQTELDSLAARLPRGFDTRLGTWFDDSVDLSEGQWQRVALARALLRPSQVVILDEPSSALDTESERRLISTLRNTLAGRSAILISHRLATVQIADKVLVLEDGRVLEYDTPSRLMARGGRFSGLVDTDRDLRTPPA